MIVDHADKERQRFVEDMQLDTYSSKCTWLDTQDICDNNDNCEKEEEGNNSTPEDIYICICYSFAIH